MTLPTAGDSSRACGLSSLPRRREEDVLMGWGGPRPPSDARAMCITRPLGEGEKRGGRSTLPV